MSHEEYKPQLRIYSYTTTTGKTGTIAAYSDIDAKRRVCNRAIAALPMEVEVREIEKNIPNMSMEEIMDREHEMYEQEMSQDD